MREVKFSYTPKVWDRSESYFQQLSPLNFVLVALIPILIFVYDLTAKALQNFGKINYYIDTKPLFAITLVLGAPLIVVPLFSFFFFVIVSKKILNSSLVLGVADEQGIQVNKINENRTWRWSVLRNVTEGKHFYYVFIKRSKYRYVVIPKRAFASDKDEQIFRDLVIEKIDKPITPSQLTDSWGAIYVIGLVVLLFCKAMIDLLGALR